jgi:hypothetical protein
MCGGALSCWKTTFGLYWSTSTQNAFTGRVVAILRLWCTLAESVEMRACKNTFWVALYNGVRLICDAFTFLPINVYNRSCSKNPVCYVIEIKSVINCLQGTEYYLKMQLLIILSNYSKLWNTKFHVTSQLNPGLILTLYFLHIYLMLYSKYSSSFPSSFSTKILCAFPMPSHACFIRLFSSLDFDHRNNTRFDEEYSLRSSWRWLSSAMFHRVFSSKLTYISGLNTVLSSVPCFQTPTICVYRLQWETSFTPIQNSCKLHL